MNAPPFDAPETWLAQAFAERVARWSRERGADALAAGAARHAAHRLSLATSAGNVCAELTSLAAEDNDPASFRARLMASRVVAPAEAPDNLPLVLDADGRLYLHRYFDYERRLAQRIARRLSAPSLAVPASTAALLDRLLPAATAPAGQRRAALLALQRPLTIVSGGPGTGKTTTVVNLLALMRDAQPDARIALAAPTGKAAARLTDAIRLRIASLPQDLTANLPAEASTIHRLLGARPDSNAFRHDAAHPLPLDVLIVDEASMLDLALAARLVDALPGDARIVLLGDKDQLAAVDAGAVFAELSSLRDERAVVLLTENFRFAEASGIGRLAADIRAGEAASALAWLRAGEDPDVGWIDDDARAPSTQTIERLIAGYAPYLDTLAAPEATLAGRFAAFDCFRVLCAERNGPRGVDGINDLVSRHVRAAVAPARAPMGSDAGGASWFFGRPVMVLRNDYVLKLFNGDVGLAFPDEAGTPTVWFPMAAGGYRPVLPVRLPQHETAFATTVHKTQGAEFDDVLLLLPARPSRVVTRELVYTAVTRSRRRATIAGGAAVFEAALATPTQRASGLLARIAEAKR